MSTPPVEPDAAAGGDRPVPSPAPRGAPRPDATDPAGRHPPSRSADPGQGSYGGWTGEGGPGAPRQPGPKGRDDADLAAALRERLEGFGDTDLSGVDVRVEDGRVTLSGRVADVAASERIELRTAEVLGVTGVDNRLTAGGA